MNDEEFARRLIRSRQWHLREAGRQRFVASDAVASAVKQTELHDAAIRDIDQELARLGRPHPPVGPRCA